MKLTIDVTQEDIDEGCRKDVDGTNGGCMVYRAFMRATEGAFPFVRVECSDILIFNNYESLQDAVGFDHNIEMPEFLEEKIIYFDSGLPVEPFSFEVDIPAGNEPYGVVAR